jgi:hypothetical protein
MIAQPLLCRALTYEGSRYTVCEVSPAWSQNGPDWPVRQLSVQG